MPGHDNRTMLCGTCIEPGRFELETRPIPGEAPEGWVLVDIRAVGLCGTDYHIFEGTHPYLAYPRLIGHELSGIVAEDVAGWAAGQLVVINPYFACGMCRACLKGKPNCCARLEVLGVHRDGGMCARIAVPAGNLYDASGLTALQAATVEFLAIGAHAVHRSEIQPGDRVLVTGAGPIGLGCALFSRLRGAEVHIMDRSSLRLDAMRDPFGFTELHTTDRPLLSGELADGFDVVFDATGHPAAMEAGFVHVAHGGNLVLVSVVKDDIRFSDPEFHKREMRLTGSRNATAEDFHAVMAAIRSGQIDTDRIVSEVIPLAELPVRLPQLATARETLVKAVVRIGDLA